MDGKERLKLGVIRRLLQECFGFVHSALESLSLAQNLDVIDPRLTVVGFKLNRALKEKFGVFQDTMAHRDLGQYPHAIDVLRILLHELPAKLFGLV